MKTLLKILLTTICIALISCDREIEVSEGLDEFNVTVDKTVFKTNEEVMFHLTGNPDMISFYSGEMFNDYKYRELRVTNLEEIIVNFRNAFPSLANSQIPELKV